MSTNQENKEKQQAVEKCICGWHPSFGTAQNCKECSCHQPKHDQVREDILKEFNSKLSDVDLADRVDVDGWMMSKKTIVGVRNFISSALDQTKEALLLELEENFTKECQKSSNGMVSRLKFKDILKAMRK